MLSKGFRLSFIAMVILTAALTCTSQSFSAVEAGDLAESTECVSSEAAGKMKFVRSLRIEEFEDSIFNIQELDYAKKLTKAAFIFKVEDTGTFITDSNEIFHITSTGYNPKLIAVLKENRKVIELFGCTNSKDNFQTLVKDAKVRLNSIADAKTFGYLFYKLTEDPDLKRIIHYKRTFRHNVENYLFGNFPDDEAKSKFRKWKKSFKSFKEDVELGLSATKHNDNYEISITYYYVRRGDERPKLHKDVIMVSSEGDIKSHTKSILFN